MLRLGIWRLEQHPAANGKPPAWWRRGHVDYRLVRTPQPPSAPAVAVFEDIVGDLQLTSGVCRTTTPDRFRDLDDQLAPVLARHFPPHTRLEVFDWAASDAAASAAWHNRLIEAFPNARVTASDLHLYLVELRVAGDAGSFILEDSGAALQYVRPPWVIRLSPPEPLWLPVNCLLAGRARSRLEKFVGAHRIGSSRIEFPEGAETVERGPLRFLKISLVHPSAIELSRSTPSFRVVRHSIFEPPAQPAHVIRTMNILNPGYFDPARLELGARSVWRGLHPGGLWIVGRTPLETSQHKLSVLRKAAGRFELEWRDREPSEIEDLALAVRP